MCINIFAIFFLCFYFQYKQKAKELGATNKEYAQTVLNLINPRTPEKRVAIMEIRKFHPCRALFYEELEEMQYDMENELGIAIEESTEYGPVEQMCPPMSKALHDDVKVKPAFSLMNHR